MMYDQLISKWCRPGAFHGSGVGRTGRDGRKYTVTDDRTRDDNDYRFVIN
jgi:hypothetical protein